nr:polymorphic toxin-type HINT domain-containing protein [Paenibacillus sp. Leaf72]
MVKRCFNDLIAYKKPINQEVVGLFQKQADEIYYVHIGDEIIEVTGEHPFWLDGKGWTFVKDLKVGDLLVSSDGTKLAIDKIEKESREATVYNFEVEDFNSYFVSNLGIWVHNCEIPRMGGADDFANEPFLPDEYYKNNYAPTQGAPGTRIDFSRLGSSGQIENSRVIYDQAGKQKYRIDYSDHGNSAHHTNPHMHEYIYQDAGRNAKELKYFVEKSTERLRLGKINKSTNKIEFID